jgi:hypothetical protein
MNKVYITQTATLRKIGESVAGDPIYTSDSGGAEPAATEITASENTHKDSACTECSRLASRVEELEAALTKISKSKKYQEARLTGESMSVLNDAIWVAEQLLAGAHAEEKR